ncbi:aminotransferase class I/II-fold pyridoxal phosphate-dependent enzyme [Dyadobacter sp. CY323]|uniref:aminotransferase class I/II-fold pyridoxal phosphate-dependent enzyme n=1 Tax=Dyadobacter sp. CY323 TaxID=2907302 RepID=UPI001F30C30A|nr:aminotransferase class I/II-fold pyridoxal phosphate-dependent enzyme [Dyadobacter sp. CY323]MCE6988837.1 aminotransferase class I/II-fold pyridoxal phosphate-dependent enzyme [Dyadobacter sp. CY323]
MNTKIWLSPPQMSGEEMKYIEEAFATNWIAPVGANVGEFENDLCKYTGSKHALALSSGTAAIHVALDVLGVTKDDIVLCQSLTFVASANPIVYLGANPVFIDSEPTTWNMCPEALETAIKHFVNLGKKPKAVIVVHLYGMPARLREIIYVCRKYGIPMVEDAAEALGSEYFGQKLGTLGDLGILSFNGNKIITTSGGGAVLSGREEYIKKARHLSTQARDEAAHYEHSEIGYNYRLSNVCAGIGRGQMEVVANRVSGRRSNFSLYKNFLVQIPGITFQEEPERFSSNRWLTVVLFDEGKSTLSAIEIKSHFDKMNIETRLIWKPMHLQPVFRKAYYFGGKCSEKLFATGLCLPSGSDLREAEIFRICTQIVDLHKSKRG